MTPVDRTAQGLLSRRQVAGAAAEEREALFEPGEQCIGGNSFTRAAASSIASGSPSNRAQMAATAGAFSVVTSKSGRTERARWMKSDTLS